MGKTIMRKSYFDSQKNTAITLQPSKAFRLLLMVLLLYILPIISFGQITQPLAWTKAYDQTSLTGTGKSFSISASANRILVVGITTTFDDNSGSDTQADPATISYGGVTLTKATGNGGTNGRMHTWLYFLKDNGVMDATSRPLAVTAGPTGATLANMSVWYAVYAGVNQTPATYTTGNGFDNTAPNNAVAALSTAMTVNANEQAIYISNIYNDNDNRIPAYSINTNWSSGGSNTGANTSGGNTVAWKVQVANRTIPVSNTTDNAQTSILTPNGTIRWAMSAMSLPRATTTTPPTITSFTPSSGCASTTPVVITGTNFTGATAVTFGGTNALSFTVNSSTQITATPAAGTSGTIKVTTPSGTFTSIGTFTVNPLPSAAGTIAGTAAVCQGQSGVSYLVPAITNATSYTWAYSGTGATITGSTNNPTISFSSTATSGNLTVYGVNACGNGTTSANYAITVNAPLTPTAVITNATCSNGSDGAITISGLLDPVAFKNSSNDNINLGTPFLSGLGKFTLDGWVNFNIADVGNRMSLYGQNDAIEFFLDKATNTITLWTPNGGSASVTIPAAIGNNTWHHLAATGDGTSIKIYIDGVLVATGGSSVGAGNYGTSTFNTEIGSGVVDPITTSGGGFTGQIETVGFYNTALSAASIASLAASPTTYLGTETGLIAGYNFFDDSGTTLSSLPTGKNGTFNNSPQWVYTYAFSWTKTGTPGYSASTKSITGLSPGTYNLSISGAGCPTILSYTVGFTNPTTAISSQSTATQTQCLGSSFTPITVTAAGVGLSYQWYKNASNSNSGGTSLVAANGAQTNSYTPQSTVAGTLYYYCVVAGTCGNATSAVSGAFITNPTTAISSQSTATQTQCLGSAFTPITVTAAGVGLSYQWYKNASNSNSGGTSLVAANGAQTNSYTPQSTVAGTLYYYCVVTGTCGNATSAVSGAFITNPNNTAGAASSTPTLCVSTALTAINHSTTGATGIANDFVSGANGLPTGVTAHFTGSNKIVINGTPTASGTFNYSIPLTGGCGIVNATGTITVTANMTAGAASSTPTLCISTLMTNITHTTAGATGIGVATGLPAGVTAVWAANTITISGTPTASGVFAYSIPLSGGCGSVNATGTITVNDLPTTPTLGTITQPDCITPTGSVVLSGLPATGTWTITQSPGGVTTTGTGTSTTISGLAAGTYNFTVTNASGCTSSATSNVVIIAAVTNTWNGTTWSNGNPTTSAFSNQALVFNGNYPASTYDLFGCSCTVNTGFNVVIDSGRTMTITNQVAVVGTGTLTFNNAASLVQINDAAINTGVITYNRNTTLVYPQDYTYWSSPVVGYTLGGVSQGLTLSNMYYSYNYTIDNWQKASAATAMTPGYGYIIGGPKFSGSPPPGPVIFNAYFMGTPNNGVINAPMGANNTSNLLGNPYPSALDADKFLVYNSGVVDGTIYFWTHNTAMQLASAIVLPAYAGSGLYAYTSDDYAAYNITGGVGTGSISVSGINVVQIPNGNIASGQGFFTTSLAPSNAVFNNSMRVNNSGATLPNTQFFKTSGTKSKTATVIEKDRIWLNMTNTQGAFKQTLVGYITGATNGYDNTFDGLSYDGNAFIDFYSVLQNMNLTIQGRALPFDQNDVVPLGFRSTISGDFSISIYQTDGLLTNQGVYIEDKLTGTTADLRSAPYTFTTAIGTFNDRFVLHYTNKTLGTTNFEALTNTVLVSTKNKEITVNSFAETINTVTIYDLLGRQIYQQKNVNNNVFTVSNLISNHEGLIVKTSLQNGKTVSDKIIY